VRFPLRVLAGAGEARIHGANEALELHPARARGCLRRTQAELLCVMCVHTKAQGPTAGFCNQHPEHAGRLLISTHTPGESSVKCLGRRRKKVSMMQPSATAEVIRISKQNFAPALKCLIFVSKERKYLKISCFDLVNSVRK